MDADEYLKISHEVKVLITAMLKLKRELQTDLQAYKYNVLGNSTSSSTSS